MLKGFILWYSPTVKMVWCESLEYNKFTKNLKLISVTENNPYNSGDLLVEVETGLGVNHQEEVEKMSVGIPLTHFVFYCF